MVNVDACHNERDEETTDQNTVNSDEEVEETVDPGMNLGLPVEKMNLPRTERVQY